jgi:photosystem II stability/assembly factor-like uncharacterized protein
MIAAVAVLTSAALAETSEARQDKITQTEPSSQLATQPEVKDMGRSPKSEKSSRFLDENTPPSFLAGEADMFVGRRGRLKRYLVCSMEGYFPVAVRTGEKSIATIFRVGAPHVGIKGTLATASSNDGGKTWSDPIEVQPRWLDTRDYAFGFSAQGEWIVAFLRAGLHSYVAGPNGATWTPAKDPVREDRARNMPAVFVARSGDNGKTWTQPQAYASPLIVDGSCYSRIIQAPDGTLLLSLYGMQRDPNRNKECAAIVVRSRDGGKTWGDESLVATGHNETAMAFLPNGRLLAASRSDGPGHISVLSSEDMGRTWSKPLQVTRDWEHPADLTVLQSGAVLMTFGRRIRPMGAGALLSDDGGKTWNTQREVLLAGDGIESLDLGYPSTVQLADGTIVTLMYFATGSVMSEDAVGGWGKVSCQAIHYREEDIR